MLRGWRTVFPTVLLALTLGLCLVVAQHTRRDAYEQAKTLVPQISADPQQECSCGCTYHAHEVDLASCGYQPKNNPRRTARLEWEHVVPAEAFGHAFPAWCNGHPACVERKGQPFTGRQCAKKMVPAFRSMEGDLHTLQPAIGEVNSLRCNSSMAMIPGAVRQFGACDVEIADRKIEPRPAIRGDIARIDRSMDWAYLGKGSIADKNHPLFTAWEQADPVDTWACERARRMAWLQGNHHPCVVMACSTR